MRRSGAIRRAGTRGGGAPVAVTPKTILGSSLKLWLRADLGVTNDGSGYCSAWADQSGNGYSFTQVTAASRPLIGASINGRATLTFDGSDDSLGSADAASVYKFLSDGSESHTFVIATQTGTSSKNSPWVANVDVAALSTTIGIAMTSLADVLNRIGMYMANGTASVPINTSAGTAVTDDVPHCLEYWIDGADPSKKYYAAVDGVEQLSAAAFGAAPSASDPTYALRIGRDRGASSRTAQGHLAEIVMLAGNATASQQTQLETYFNSRYSITFS